MLAARSALAAMRTDDRDWRNGRCFALVFHAGSEVEEIAREAKVRTVLSNNLGFGGQNASVVFRAV